MSSGTNSERILQNNEELQQIENKLAAISSEKNSKIIPENIKERSNYI